MTFNFGFLGRQGTNSFPRLCISHSRFSWFSVTLGRTNHHYQICSGRTRNILLRIYFGSLFEINYIRLFLSDKNDMTTCRLMFFLFLCSRRWGMSQIILCNTGWFVANAFTSCACVVEILRRTIRRSGASRLKGFLSKPAFRSDERKCISSWQTFVFRVFAFASAF